MKLQSFLVAALATLALTVSAQQQTDVTIPGPNGDLKAVVTRPAAAADGKKVPLVIVCHGFMGNMQSSLLTAICDSLQARGIGSIRFDFDGHGKSGGRFEDMTVPKEIADAETVYGYARALPWVNRIGIAGHSQGGVVSAMTAGELGDKRIKAVALLAPAAVLRDDALRGTIMGKVYNPHAVPADGVELWGGKRLGKAYIESAQGLPIYDTARRYHGPALIVHGTWDTVVPYTYGERFAQLWRGSQLVLMPGVDHGFSGKDAECAHLVAAFMAKKLK